MSSNQLVTKIATKLCKEINKITIEAHWDKKIWYKQGHHSMMDFEMARRALCSLPKAQQWWVTKMAAQFLPYRTNMKRWNLWTDNQRPRCHQPAEGKSHLTQCQVTGAQQQWETTLQNTGGVDANRTNQTLNQKGDTGRPLTMEKGRTGRTNNCSI